MQERQKTSIGGALIFKGKQTKFDISREDQTIFSFSRVDKDFRISSGVQASFLCLEGRGVMIKLAKFVPKMGQI